MYQNEIFNYLNRKAISIKLILIVCVCQRECVCVCVRKEKIVNRVKAFNAAVCEEGGIRVKGELIITRSFIIRWRKWNWENFNINLKFSNEIVIISSGSPQRRS